MTSSPSSERIIRKRCAPDRRWPKCSTHRHGSEDCSSRPVEPPTWWPRWRMCGHRRNRLRTVLLFEIAVWAAATASFCCTFMASSCRHGACCSLHRLIWSLRTVSACIAALAFWAPLLPSWWLPSALMPLVEATARESRASCSRSVFIICFGLNLVNLLLFAAFVAAGLSLRSRPDFHKRLMLMATLSLLAPAVARIVLLFTHGPMAQFLTFDFCVLTFVAIDTIRRRQFASGIWIKCHAPRQHHSICEQLRSARNGGFRSLHEYSREHCGGSTDWNIHSR